MADEHKADVWPEWFGDDGYGNLMQQLQDHGVTYATLYAVARVNAQVVEATLRALHLNFNHDTISELWRRCKDTPPGTAPVAGAVGQPDTRAGVHRMVVDPARLSQYSGLSRKFAWHAVTGVRLVANDDGLHPTPSSGDAQATAGGVTTTAADTTAAQPAATAAYSTADTNTAWLYVGCNNEVRCLAMAGCGWAHGVRRTSAGDPDAVRQAGRVTRKRGRANNVAGDGGTRQRRARKRKRRPGPAPSLNSADGAAVDAVARAGAGAGAGAGSGSGSGSGVGKLPRAAKDVLLKWLAKRDDIDALWKQFHSIVFEDKIQETTLGGPASTAAAHVDVAAVVGGAASSSSPGAAMLATVRVALYCRTFRHELPPVNGELAWEEMFVGQVVTGVFHSLLASSKTSERAGVLWKG